jgi:saccharopine dehydrogenase-like protein
LLDQLDGRAVGAGMKRVIVLGGLGLFGRTAAAQLRRLGITVLTASRGLNADLQIDANDRASIRNSLRPGDLVIDAAGPFRERSATLVEAAIEAGFDIVDINDDLTYAEKVLALETRITSAGIRVLSSASSVSAVGATVVRHSRVVAPKRVTAFLAPATRHTANSGAALSLLGSIGRPIRIYRDGRQLSLRGWSELRRFTLPAPVGRICSWLFESADALYLPRIWSTLREVTMYVDANVPGGNTMLRLAASRPAIRRMMEQHVHVSTWLARKAGSPAGGLGYEIEDSNGKIVRWAITSPENSYLVAVAPAVLAAQSIVEHRFSHRGLVLPDRHVEPDELFGFFQANGITLTELD